jgi:quercetin dioxygenase-like cupin family protein
LSTALDFYTNELGFRIDVILPADSPREFRLSGHGIHVRLERDDDEQWDDNRVAVEGEWVTGRAGMHYRDLIPGRLDGRFIASHIRIPQGGPVPDYVHHHDVLFQMIYCYRGWVKVVYEDQGEPFVMQAGDCVLQPPHIRHRVLECSDNMEVIEVSSPAEHETFVDHDMKLPTATLKSGREFGGQRFVHHQLSDAKWAACDIDGAEAQESGIGNATKGLASVRIVRPASDSRELRLNTAATIFFNFVLQGTANMRRQQKESLDIAHGNAFVLQGGEQAILTDCSNDLELLQVQS